MDSQTQILPMVDDWALGQGVSRISKRLHQATEESAQSEDRFRDLFEEAPIADLYEDIDSRIIRANRTARRILGVERPGNIRQLQNVIERSIILCQEGPLTFDIPASRTSETSCEIAKLPANQALVTREELKRQERDAIAAALKQTNGKVSGPGGAAELLGMKPSTLSSRVAALSVRRKTLN